jgi:hypothetical protein
MSQLPSKSTRVPVSVQSDFMQQQARTDPIKALAECIWNGLDADASHVAVEIERNPIGLQRIVIRDDGRGLTRAQAPELFSKLGDSWKKRRGRTESGRALHGSEGRGRYKVTVLGRVAEWNVTYLAEDRNYRRFSITVFRDDLKEISISDEFIVEEARSGVELVISEPLADFRSLQSDDTPQELTEIFASYLRNYPGVSISLQGLKLDPSTVISGTFETNLPDVNDRGKVYPARLEIVEWHRSTKRVLYLCDEHGFPMLSVDTRWHVGERFFSAYLRSPLIREMNDRNEIGLGEMNPNLAGSVEEARSVIKGYFRSKAAQAAQNDIDEWKAESSYPYKQAPVTPVEKVEREVFDIMATTAARYLPDFKATTPKSRAFQLRMMRTAIENGSEDLQLILKEVLGLPVRQQEELAQLLQETSLTSIISASKVVADRLRFLTGLEALIFDRGIGSTLRERTQLHRILADNTWIFGEEHHLMIDDQSLDECLKEHTKIRGSKEELGAVKHPTKKRGIVDMMFGKQRRSHHRIDLEHLVVELKAPKVTIGFKQISQIDGYVAAIRSDSRFDFDKTSWVFWVLSKKIDPTIMRLRQVQNAEVGVVLRQDNLLVIAKTWAQVIADNRSRLKFFQEGLDYKATKADALLHMQSTYSDLLSGTKAGDIIEQITEDQTDFDNDDDDDDDDDDGETEADEDGDDA